MTVSRWRPSMAALLAWWCPICIFGRVPSGCVDYGSWKTTSQAFGNRSVTTTTAIRGKRNATVATSHSGPRLHDGGSKDETSTRVADRDDQDDPIRNAQGQDLCSSLAGLDAASR